MQPPITGVTVPILINSLPDLACAEVNSIADAIQVLAQYGTVEIPTSITNVIVGFSEPTSDDINKIWFRYDVNANFLGIYAFQNGGWHPVVMTSALTDIFWKYRATNIPATGFTIIDSTGPSFIDSVTRAYLESLYVWDVGHTFYIYAAYAFTGY